MLLRRSLPVAAAAAALAACAPSVPHEDVVIDYAVFDPANSQIPQPNDLVFQALQQGTIPPGAQQDLLAAFAQAKGFPNDQEVPIDVDFQHLDVGGAKSAPALDTTKLVVCTGGNGATCTVGVLRIDGSTPAVQALQPPKAADYVTGSDRGSLAVHNAGSKRWPTNAPSGATPAAPARYLVAVRGGPKGLQTSGGGTILPSATFALLLGSGPIPLSAGTDAQRQQLSQLRAAYAPAFAAVDAVLFPHGELIALSVFSVAPLDGSVHVETDPQVSVPLPSDFLLDATGKRVANLPSAFGALAPGIATLDGFSTTAMLLAQTSGPIAAATVTTSNVKLFKVTPAAVTRLKDVAEAGPSASYVTEPPQLVQAGAALAIGLQPAAPIIPPTGSPFALPPLEENTTYAVVVTDGVTDITGKPITRSTLAKILLGLAHPLVDAQGHSQLSGVSDGQAQGLSQMQTALGAVFQSQAIDKTHVMMAYTLRTQTITGKAALTDPTQPNGALQLAALPYANAAATTSFVPGPVNAMSATAAFNKYGVEQNLAPFAVPSANILEVLETTIPTQNLLSVATGAFTQPPVPVPETLNVLISVPAASTVPTPCPGSALKCAPLVVFHHGLGGGRSQMLLVANELNQKGLVVAAIDAPKHGDRSWCSKDSECASGAPGSCVAIPGAATQGDATPPGICTGGLKKNPTLCGGAGSSCAITMPTDGVAIASSNYLVSANFFRTRDTLRQDIVDHAALILALARPPPPALPGLSTPTTVATRLATADGIAIDPRFVYWEGQSLGSLLGTVNVAVNSRISKAALNVGGGTIVDVFSTKGSAFYPSLQALLSAPPIGITFDPTTGDPATPTDAAKFLQILQVAKWIFDPADPINFAGHITANTLPDLLNTASPGAAQANKAALGQMAECDKTIPNQTNLNLYLNMGLGPFYSGTPTPGTLALYVDTTTGSKGACVGIPTQISLGDVPHGFLANWGYVGGTTGSDPSVNGLTLKAQDDAAAFLSVGTQPPNYNPN